MELSRQKNNVTTQTQLMETVALQDVSFKGFSHAVASHLYVSIMQRLTLVEMVSCNFHSNVMTQTLR
jgi:hypothetical protein